MSDAPEKVGEGRAYWTHKVDKFPSPVAVTRMAQLIDFDDRLYETARVVYRFMVSWYHHDYGDALLSQRHVAKVMKQRAPLGAVVPSRNAVQRAIIALMDTGWVVRSFQGRGKGKGASRYVPVLNVLDLAAQGNFPEPAHANGPVDLPDKPAHSNGPLVAHATGPVDAEPAHANGPKTLLPDPPTGGVTEREIDCAAPTAPPLVVGLAATPAAVTAQGGFEQLWNAYAYRRGKAEAKRAYSKLAPDADLHATLVNSAKAWRDTWAAQNKPEAPRFTLAKWIEREEYECEPPTAFKPKERKAPATGDKTAAPAKGKLTDVLRILEVKFMGSPFGEYLLWLFFDGAAGKRQHVLRVLTEDGVGEDNESFNKMRRAFGDNAEDWIGERLRLELDGERVVDVVADRKPARVVAIANASVVEADGEQTLVASVTDEAGQPEGTIKIVYQSNDHQNQASEQKRLQKLVEATGLHSLDDSDQLIGRSLFLTASGDFLPVLEAA